MPINVTADIAHPSAMEDFSQSPTDLFRKVRKVRVFLVEGLADGSATQEATALSRALSATGIPQLWELAPGRAGQLGGIAINFSTLTIPQSTDSVYILVTYENVTPNNVTGIPWLVSDSSQEVTESTELHPKDKAPMVFSYQPPEAAGDPNAIGVPGGSTITSTDKAAKPIQHQAHFRYQRTLRKIVLNGVSLTTGLDAIRDMHRCVNQGEFLKLQTGYWRLTDFDEQGILFGTVVKVRVGMLTRVDEDWSSWEVFFDPALGRRVTVNPDIVRALRNRTYDWGWHADNGIIKAGLYKTASFKTIFSNLKLI